MTITIAGTPAPLDTITRIMPEPQRDHSGVDTGVQQPHRGGVAQDVGVIVFAVSDGQRSAAAVACLVIRRASALRVSVLPVLVGNSGSAGGPARSASHTRSTAAVCLVRGLILCLRPLPVVVTCAPVPRWMSPPAKTGQL